MTDLSILAIARQHARWLMDRQHAIADNIAHAATPGFRAVDVQPFAAEIDPFAVSMASTDNRHISIQDEGRRQTHRIALKGDATSHSGNTVSIDEQLLMSNEVHQGYALNTGIVKSLHRMIMSAVKGS